MIPLSEPYLTGDESKKVQETLAAGWVSSSGPYVSEFECAFSNYVESQHAVACVNGSAALHLALLVAGVKPGDEVIVPSITFAATVNAAIIAGAKVIFMDCDDFYNLDPSKVLEFLESETVRTAEGSINRVTKRRIAAICPVHVFGNAIDIAELAFTCRDRDISIVEDAAESLGTRWLKDSRHSGTIGDLGCFSFNGNKIITTGGGGMLVTDDESLARRARHLATQARSDPIRYHHDEVGFNYRLTSIQAAVGIAQLGHIEEFVDRKAAIYKTYREEVEGIPGLQIADVPPYARNNHWMVALQVNSDVYGTDIEGLMQELSAMDIQSRPLWRLNHLHPYLLSFQQYRLENCVQLAQRTLNIPCSVGLTEEDQEAVVSALKEIHHSHRRRRAR